MARALSVRPSQSGPENPMYICICNALKDKELAAASSDARTVADVFRRCGARPQCGKCLADVAQIIEDVREQENDTLPLAAE
jgi:bacterioferritin-associated ferredoxin